MRNRLILNQNGAKENVRSFTSAYPESGKSKADLS